jgi:hypothetical protein
MTSWPTDELRKIAEADDLHVSPFREDGARYGTPTWIWSVAVGDDLYMSAYNGQDSSLQPAVRPFRGTASANASARWTTRRPSA